MVTWDDVRRLALALPETAERASYGGAPSWTVQDRAFVWERPLRSKDLAEVDGDPGPLLGVRVADEGVKQALLADQPEAFLTTSHFDGHSVVLARLQALTAQELEELVTEAWLARASTRLRESYTSSPRR